MTKQDSETLPEQTVESLSRIPLWRMSTEERRKYQRHVVNIPAMIDCGDGSPMRDCTVLEISDAGARVSIESSETLPIEFTLLLTRGGVRRRCRLVWRSEQVIGVEFVTRTRS